MKKVDEEFEIIIVLAVIIIIGSLIFILAGIACGC